MPSIVWIAPGNMVPACPGLVGDVLVAVAVVRYLAGRGFRSRFITNELMRDLLRTTFAAEDGVTVSAMLPSRSGFKISAEDLRVARNPEINWFLILRSESDTQGCGWMQQLLDAGIAHGKIRFFDHLDPFTREGPHMIRQICLELERFIFTASTNDSRHAQAEVAALADFDFSSIYPILNPFTRKRCKYLLLPFAGGVDKWIPLDRLLREITALDAAAPGVEVMVVGTKFDYRQHPAEMAGYREALCSQDKAQFILKESLPDVALEAVNCAEVFCADGGLTWATVSVLNWCVEKGLLPMENYPAIKVYFATPGEGKPVLSSAAVWRPVTPPGSRDKVSVVY